MATENMYTLDETQPYPFIPSTEEHKRLEEQSAAQNELMLNKSVCAPLTSSSKILDVGCGTGHQTDRLAQMYPEAQIIGLDKSPVPGIRPKRDNITYILGSFDDVCGTHKILQPETFDYVYQRMFVMGVASWPKHLQAIKTLLKPGGYFESQEFYMWDLYDKDENLVSGKWKCLEVSQRYPREEHGIDLTIPKKLPALIREAGFEDVRFEQFPMAFQGGWKERPETERMGRYLNWATRPWWGVFLRKGAREGEDAEEFVREWEDEILDGEVGLHGHFMVTVGRKG